MVQIKPKTAPISYLADAAAQATFSRADLAGLRVSLLVHAAGGLLVLLTVVTLAICKPAGMIPPGPALQALARAPRWVKAFLGAAFVLILLIGVMLLAGGHGPGAHA